MKIITRSPSDQLQDTYTKGELAEMLLEARRIAEARQTQIDMEIHGHGARVTAMPWEV